MSESILEDETPRKRCYSCKETFPATPQYFSRNKSKKDGLHDACKICDSAKRKAYTESHREQESLSRKHYRDTHKEELSEQKKIYQKENKERLAAYMQQYQQGEHYKEYQRQYQLEHKQEISEWSKQYYQDHREETCERQRAYMRTEKGRAVDRAHRHKRKAQKKEIEGTLTSQEIQTKLKAQKHTCYYCLRKFEMVKGKYVYHLEHTIPVSRTEHNPRHDVNYVVLACPTCNMEKHDKLPHEWSRGNRLL